MNIWPIDFNKTLEEISEWFDEWRVERFGKDSLDPIKYYTSYVDGKILVEKPKEGESLDDEKEKCDKVLELLIRIKQINDKLSGKALSRHLQWRERERLKGERETLYKAFLDEVQTEPEQAAQVPQPISNVFTTSEALTLLEKAIGKGLLIVDGDKYKWNETARPVRLFCR